MITYPRKTTITSYIIILVRNCCINQNIYIFHFKGQAYVNFLSASFNERKVTFSCLCAECNGIEWRRDNVPLPKSSYGVVTLQKELWPHHSINLKHSTFSTSYFDSYLYSCNTVHYQNDIFQNSPAYIEVPCKYMYN